MIKKEEIVPEHFWYIVGYIAADGNLSNDGRHINITSKDRAHLIKIKRALKLKNKVGRKGRGGSKEKHYSCLQFGDVAFYRFLTTIGFSSRKSLTLGAITVDHLYITDFLRGVIDGDGNISTWIHRTNGNRQWSLRLTSASPVFVQWLKGVIESRFDVRGKLYCYTYANKKNPIYILKFGKLTAKVIIKSCYYKDCFSLHRKNIKSAECLRDESKMVNYAGVLGPGAVIGSQPRLKIE